MTLKNSQISILNWQKSENRFKETANETCLCSLKHSEHALTEHKESEKKSVPFDYTSFGLFRFREKKNQI